MAQQTNSQDNRLLQARAKLPSQSGFDKMTRVRTSLSRGRARTSALARSSSASVSLKTLSFDLHAWIWFLFCNFKTSKTLLSAAAPLSATAARRPPTDLPIDPEPLGRVQRPPWHTLLGSRPTGCKLCRSAGPLTTSIRRRRHRAKYIATAAVESRSHIVDKAWAPAARQTLGAPTKTEQLADDQRTR